MDLPRILTFADYYLPGYKAGGPVRTISNFVDHLKTDVRFLIVTRDRDIADPVAYEGVRINDWNDIEGARVFYVPPRGLNLSRIAWLMRQTDHDLVYLNSFFSPRMTFLPLLAMRLGLAPRKSCILAPRGEFGLGALRLKPLKKGAVLAVSKWLSLYRDVTWHATSEFEACDIRRGMGHKVQQIAIAPNLPRRPAPIRAPHSRQTDAPLRLIFLSRISPMKNLDYALRVLAIVQVPVTFAIYGPIEDAIYWKRCQERIAGQPSNICVEYKGLVKPDNVVATLSRHDLFFLPTLGENFGQVLHEALSAGMPILISDQTPWRDLADKGVGWDLPLSDASAFVSRIEEVAGWSDKEHQKWASRARELAAKVANDPDTLDANRRLFLDAIAGHKIEAAR